METKLKIPNVLGVTLLKRYKIHIFKALIYIKIMNAV